MEALEEGSGKEKQSHFILLIQPKHKSFICIFQLFYFIFFLSDTFSFMAPVTIQFSDQKFLQSASFQYSVLNTHNPSKVSFQLIFKIPTSSFNKKKLSFWNHFFFLKILRIICLQ